MSRSETFTDRIVKLERLQSSRNGNPRWLVSFAEHGAYKTEVDGSVGYGIENRDLHDGQVEVTLERIRGTEQVTHLKAAETPRPQRRHPDEVPRFFCTDEEWDCQGACEGEHFLPDSPDALAYRTGL